MFIKQTFFAKGGVEFRKILGFVVTPVVFYYWLKIAAMIDALS